MSAPKVFISYSHDSPTHSERVRDLAWALRSNGIEVELDQFHQEEIVDWPRWCNQQLSREHSDFVVCVCTAEYKRRVEGQVPPEKGKGVYWEGSLLDDDIYDEKGNRRVILVLLDDEIDSAIPRFLRGWTHCRLREFALDDSGYEHLLRILTGQAKVEKNALGAIPVLPSYRAPSGSQSSARQEFQADISRIAKYAPAELIGREDELKLLNDAWAKIQTQESKRPHALTFVALGGEGKTSLVAKWAAELAHQDWPGCDAAFAWSFYSQGTREQVAASSDLFLKEALTFFGDDTDKQFAASSAGAFEKGQRLARIVSQRRSLLILDGLEPLQYAPTSPTPGQLKDQGIAALLKSLATASHGLCIVTTRYSLPDLKAFWQTTAPEVKLLCLSREAGVHLLKTLGVRGTEQEFATLVEDVKGHALTLNLLGTYLRDAHAGDIRKRDLAKLEEADAEEQGGHAFRVMEAYEREFEREGDAGRRALAVLRLLGLFDRPLTSDYLGALLQAPAIPELTEPLVGLTEAQRNLAFKRLEDARLLTVNRDASGALISLDAHPLLREYFARQLRANQSDAWRGAHRRLYEHLCATTTECDQPTLEDLQPLYQAVAHGCQAGLQQEAYEKVYFARIKRRNEYYSARKLGAYGADLGAIACFFDEPWKRISRGLDDVKRALVLSQAATWLRALGRLTEALEPMRAALEMCIERAAWDGAAIDGSNVSELELTLGEVARAVGDAEKSVTYADRSGDAFLRKTNRARVADALHQAGRSAEAETRFREAEQMQAERQPDYPLLFSVSGFQYCDLLLAASERAAWRITLNLSFIPHPSLLPACGALFHRAAQTFDWSVNVFDFALLSIALNHLTLGRAALYAAILEDSAESSLPAADEPMHSNSERRGWSDAPYIEARRELDAAVDGLRRAGTTHHIPRALLTRAWCSFAEASSLAKATKDESAHELRSDAQEAARLFSRAQEDLDEAWEVAERGSMKLFITDIHLYRARLFGSRSSEVGSANEAGQYPWESPAADLAAAEKLIHACGYHRRDEELADAKAVLLAT